MSGHANPSCSAESGMPYLPLMVGNESGTRRGWGGVSKGLVVLVGMLGVNVRQLLLGLRVLVRSTRCRVKHVWGERGRAKDLAVLCHGAAKLGCEGIFLVHLFLRQSPGCTDQS